MEGLTLNMIIGGWNLRFLLDDCRCVRENGETVVRECDSSMASSDERSHEGRDDDLGAGRRRRRGRRWWW